MWCFAEQPVIGEQKKTSDKANTPIKAMSQAVFAEMEIQE